MRIKAAGAATADGPSVKEGVMHPYLVLVLAAYAVFVGVLGFYSLRQYLSREGG